jgi:hypothetical protein
MRFFDQLKLGIMNVRPQPSEAAMPSVNAYASTILRALEDAQAQLVGKAVVLTDGKAGTVEEVWLDEGHGLRISIKGHDGKWPVSTIKFAEDMGNTQLN